MISRSLHQDSWLMTAATAHNAADVLTEPIDRQGVLENAKTWHAWLASIQAGILQHSGQGCSCLFDISWPHSRPSRGMPDTSGEEPVTCRQWPTLITTDADGDRLLTYVVQTSSLTAIASDPSSVIMGQQQPCTRPPDLAMSPH